MRETDGYIFLEDHGRWASTIKTISKDDWLAIHTQYRSSWVQEDSIVLCLLYCVECPSMLVVHQFTVKGEA